MLLTNVNVCLTSLSESVLNINLFLNNYLNHRIGLPVAVWCFHSSDYEDLYHGDGSSMFLQNISKF
jgi:hypothetical protein